MIKQKENGRHVVNAGDFRGKNRRMPGILLHMAVWLVLLFIMSDPLFSQELSEKSWPKNIRQNFEERNKQEDINFNEYFDRQIRTVLLHPEKVREMNEKKLKKMKSSSWEEETGSAGEQKGKKELRSVPESGSGEDKGETGCQNTKKDAPKPSDRLCGVLKSSDVFTYYPMWQQMTTTEVLASSGILTFLLENDRLIFTEMDKAVKGHPFWEKNGEAVNAIGDGLTAVGLYSVLAIAGGEKNLKTAQVGLESFAYTGLQVIGMKHTVGRSRPSNDFETRWTLNGDDAFPSGHTATAFSMATVLDRMYNIGWLTYPLAGLNGIARIQATTHWLSDVFAGALMGHFGAKEIMARHGLISRNKLQRRDSWENTLYDVNSYVENSFDSCANFDDLNAKQDNVGIMAMNYSIAHCITPQVAVLLSSRFHKKTFNTFSWNNVEDKQVDIKLAHKVASHGVLYVGSQFQDINYIDINPTRFNSAPGHNLSDPENWLEHNRLDSAEAGFMWEFSPNLHGKVSYRTFTDYYDEFEFLNGYGNVWGVDMGSDFGNKQDLSLSVGYRSGNHSAAFPQYTYDLDGLTVRLKKDFSDTCNVNLIHSQEKRSYNGSAYDFLNKERDNWSLTGVELNKDFQNDWTASLRYYQKNLSSTNPLWSYRKKVYSINITSRF